jgi:hypothetical protein
MKFTLERVEFLVGAALQVDQPVACIVLAADQPIEFEMHGTRIPVLRVLDQEYHQEVAKVVPVLMTSCHASRKTEHGSASAHASTTTQAPTNAHGLLTSRQHAARYR